MHNEVVVTNRNPKPHTDGWRGMTWTFETGKPVTIPLEAAVHIFGLNKQDKTQTLVRLGLGNHPDGKQWLSNVHMKYQEYVPADEVQELEGLRIDIGTKQDEITALNEKLAALEAELDQLKNLNGKK